MKSLRVRINEGTWRAVRTLVLISLTSGQGDFRLKTVKPSWPERRGIYRSARREQLLYNKTLVMASDGNNLVLCTTVFSDYDIPWYFHTTPKYTTLNNTMVLPPLTIYGILKYTMVLKFKYMYLNGTVMVNVQNNMVKPMFKIW